MSDSDQPGGRVRVQSASGPIEIELLDWKYRSVGKGFGQLELNDVAPGLYTLQATAGDMLKREHISIDGGGQFEQLNYSLEFRSPAPVDGTSTCHEFHSYPAADLSRAPNQSLGGGGRLMVFVRNAREEDSPDSTPINLDGFELCDRNLQPIAALGELVQVDPQRGWAGFCADVEPGGFTLRWREDERAVRSRSPDATFDQSLWVSREWTTCLFVSTDARTGRPRQEGAVVYMARIDMGFQPYDDREANLALELALRGLRRGEANVPDNLLDLLLGSKFTNPMLGIVGAHALLQARRPRWKLYDIVVDNLERLVAGHPDVTALRVLGLVRRRAPVTLAKAVSWPPMLYASYSGLVAGDWKHRGTIAEDSVAERISAALVPQGPWSVWSSLEPAAERPAFLVQETLASAPFFTAGLEFLASQLDVYDPVSTPDAEPLWEPAVQQVAQQVYEIGQFREESGTAQPAHLSLEQVGRPLGLPVATVERAIRTLAVSQTGRISMPSSTRVELTKKYYISSGKDGELEETSTDDVRALVQELQSARKIALHIHGGLVNQPNAMRRARLLLPYYLEAGIHPVFIVWETGFIETIQNNLHEIRYEKIFQYLLKKLMQWIVGKLTQTGTAKAAGRIHLPRDLDVSKEAKKLERQEIPFETVQPVADLADVTDAERQQFQDALAADAAFQAELQAIIEGARPEAETVATTAKGATSLHRRSSETLMSPEVVDEIVEDSQAGAKGVRLGAKILIRAGKVFYRVVKRFVQNRDHGVYTSVVEEVLREFYVANIGGWIWGRMKQDAQDTFENAGNLPARAGWFFFQELGRLLQGEGHRPEVSVVAHSAGAIYASHMLSYVAAARRDGVLPPDFRFQNVLFLAPAVDFKLFAEALQADPPTFEHFRTYALNDQLEAGYWEIPAVYPRSLLYFVSGVVERKEGDESAFDRPLVGMQRYYDKPDVYGQPEVQAVRQFLSAEPKRAVWSEEDRGPGLACDALYHGAFQAVPPEERPKGMQSVLHVLHNGW